LVPRQIPLLTSMANKILRRGSKAALSQRNCDAVHGYEIGENISISEREAREQTENKVVSVQCLGPLYSPKLTQFIRLRIFRSCHATRSPSADHSMLGVRSFVGYFGFGRCVVISRMYE
jgi:hypothetical protein